MKSKISKLITRVMLLILIFLRVNNVYSSNYNKIEGRANIYIHGEGNIVEFNYKDGVNDAKKINSPWNLPYQIVQTYYVSRENKKHGIISKFQLFKKNHLNIVSLTGLGGSGKTYLAIDVINKIYNNYSFVGWFEASSEESLTREYIKLGNKLGILSKENSEVENVCLVKEWLNNQQKILLVYDNIPDLSIFYAFTPKEGDIILTSTNTQMISNFEVEGMEELEAVNLLEKLITGTNNKSDITMLAKKLEYFPLALSQAGSYIHYNKISIKKYLEIYEKQKSYLLSSNQSNSIQHLPCFVTWDISFKRMMQDDPSQKSLELLCILAFCNDIHIPKDLVQKLLYNDLDDKSILDFNEKLSLARRYSFINNEQESHISMHKLVQEFILSKLSLEEKREILNKFIKTSALIFPISEENHKTNSYTDIYKIREYLDNY